MGQDMWELKQANRSVEYLKSRLARYSLPWLPQCSDNMERDARNWIPASRPFNVLAHKRKSLYYSVVGSGRRGRGAKPPYYRVVHSEGGRSLVRWYLRGGRVSFGGT